MRRRRFLCGLGVFAVLCLSFLLSHPLLASDAPSNAGQAGTAQPPSGSSEQRAQARSNPADDIALLREQVALQQKQIEQLRGTLETLKERLERVAEPSRAAASRLPILGQEASLAPVNPGRADGLEAPAKAPALPGAASRAVAAAASAGGALGPQSSGVEGAKRGPLSIRIGDADLTVGGFMDFTAFFRSTNLGSGIGTSFGSIPFSNTSAGRLTETRFSAQNSRVSLKLTSKVGANNVTGYVESDFLGFQPTNGFVTSNSNSLRMRLYWVDVQRGKFEILGGQSWSMLNPNRTGLSPNPSDIFYSQDMDTNYQVGLTWARQAQFRVIYHPSKEWAMGVSLENPQQFVGGAVVLPSSTYASQIDTGSNTATANLHPDIIAKIAYDPTVGGKHMHLEAAGLLRSFRIFDPSTNAHSTVTGGGGSLNANLELVKDFHLILNTFYSDGGGRYIFGLGPDLIIRPDGSPSAVHSGSGIAGFEYQVKPNTMLYAYYGGAYYQRNTAIDPATGKPVGFGFIGSSSSSNRAVQEGTFGFIQTFWKNPHYGALQMINQYSYLTRSPWWVAPNTPKNAHLSMGYVNLRYVLP